MQTRQNQFVTGIMLGAAALITASPAHAQQHLPAKYEIPFNRFYDYEEITAHLRGLVNAYPELLSLQSIGKSEQGREMWVVTMNNPDTGPDVDKPAMWIDGNVHGNEIQAAETVLYSVWYLAKSYGHVESLTELVDRTAFYFLPMQNPDGRAFWFDEPNTSSSSRSGQRPTDNDYDGLLDEDGPEDLDGDGHIGTMYRFDPNGRYRRNEKDPRIFERVPADEVGDLTRVGSEGIDNDGDGRINEDGAGGYDMNRNWPSGWQPSYIQYGAGEYALDRPETKSIAQFILAHPNIAAGQSYHNAGGMILRGPGQPYRTNLYPGSDMRVYEELGRAGEELLPFYRYMVLFSDLYPVHGGFVNWLGEGLGIVSYTNELWSNSRILQNPDKPYDTETRMRIIDRLFFSQNFTDYTEYDHPTLGRVLIGGNTKFSGRTPPNFMLEEECHRNFAFTMFHAGEMPELEFKWIESKSIVDGLWQITVEVENDRIIPSRTGVSARNKIGQPDRLTLTGDVEVAVSGTLSDRLDLTIDPVPHRKHVVTVENGIPGRNRVTFRFLVTGDEGTAITLSYTAEKALNIETTFPLSDTVIEADEEE